MNTEVKRSSNRLNSDLNLVTSLIKMEKIKMAKVNSKKNDEIVFALPEGFEETKRGRNTTIPVEAFALEIVKTGKVLISIHHSSDKKTEGSYSSLGVRKAISGKGWKYVYCTINGVESMMIASKAYASAFNTLNWR